MEIKDKEAPNFSNYFEQNKPAKQDMGPQLVRVKGWSTLSRLVIKISGGRVSSRNQIDFLLVFIVLIFVGASVFVWAYYDTATDNGPITKPSPLIHPEIENAN